MFLVLLVTSHGIVARTITVKYRDTPVDVDNGAFIESMLKSSSLVKEIYYDEKGKYLLVRLKSTFYHYCGINRQTVDRWGNADSLGRFYLQNIKGEFDCRINFVPEYE